MLTFTCNVDPLTPRFCIVKLGFTGIYIFSFFSTYGNGAKENYGVDGGEL